MTMRIVLAILMGLHGIAHLPGFVHAWNLTELKGLPYRTTVLAGRIDLGDVGIRAVGTLWLLTATAFLISACSLAAGKPWWLAAALATALASLVLGALGWPEAKIGVAVNVVIILAVALMVRLGTA
jgi:hypothetical protein